MTHSNTSTPTIPENDNWTAVRKVLTDAHKAIQKVREDAIPRRWYAREETVAASWILTFICLLCLLVAISNPHGHGTLAFVMLMMMILCVPLLCVLFDIEKSWEQNRNWARDLPFTDPELQTIASLPVSPQTPGYKAWKAAAADHPLGLSDLENLIRAIDDHHEAEHERHVLQHQNQIIFQNREAT